METRYVPEAGADSLLSGENQQSEPQANTNAQKLGVIQILEVAVPILNLVERR